MGLAAPDHTVPYGTVLARTLSQASCQATIGVSPPGRTCRRFATALNLAPFDPAPQYLPLLLGLDIGCRFGLPFCDIIDFRPPADRQGFRRGEVISFNHCPRLL
jgi:hypothetical protein